MHIGLIGGIGPAATIAYYRRLVDVFRDRDMQLELTIVHADVMTLSANASANRVQQQAEIFAHHLQQLKGAGCDIATITALTGHFCFEETQSLSPLPLVNAISTIDDYCLRNEIKKLALLGSPPVLKAKLFGMLTAPEIIVPGDDLDDLGNSYMELALGGVCSAENRQKFFDAGAEMVTGQGADALLLAGTDLGLAFDNHDPGYPVLDALEIHVAALVDQVAKN